jgi:hypothetical protein
MAMATACVHAIWTANAASIAARNVAGFAVALANVRISCAEECIGKLVARVETSSSVSLACYGSVSSDLPFKALQTPHQHGIVADKYVLSPHSVNLFVPVKNREAAVKALHSLI